VAHKILIIDDEDDIREVAALSLETVAGWEVITANTGAQGLARAIEHLPDAILLDVMMPGMDGPTTFNELRKNPVTAHIPVLLLTTHSRRSSTSPSPTSLPHPTRRIWPVRELVSQVRELVEQQYGDVWVEGEISNYRPAPSGHVYFTLKDADAQLPIVLFRRQAMLLRFRPEDGLHVLVRGRVSVYEQRGQMQLVAETMEPVGAGSLQLAFEQLKERLKAEGLFDAAASARCPLSPHRRHRHLAHRRRHSRLPQHRRPPPLRPQRAAGPRLRPGRSGPRRNRSRPHSTLNAALAAPLVDLIVLARGGGSLEDLAAFNSERVARAIASPRSLPVVSAIGHETDFTIADFAADLRAPTPSAAAELITEAQHKIAEHLATNRTASSAPPASSFSRPASASPACPSAAPSRASPRCCIAPPSASTTSPSALNPLSPRNSASASARSPSLAAAVLRHDPRQALAQARERLFACRTRLDRSARAPPPSLRRRLGALDGRLHSLSPTRRPRSRLRPRPQRRGRPHPLHQPSSIPGDQLTTRLADGAFTSRVESTAGPAKKRK
jgi:exodeoxyribonuclease VII large subunit